MLSILLFKAICRLHILTLLCREFFPCPRLKTSVALQKTILYQFHLSYKAHQVASVTGTIKAGNQSADTISQGGGRESVINRDYSEFWRNTSGFTDIFWSLHGKSKTSQRVPMADQWLKYFRNKELIVNLELVNYCSLSRRGLYYRRLP